MAVALWLASASPRHHDFEDDTTKRDFLEYAGGLDNSWSVGPLPPPVHRIVADRHAAATARLAYCVSPIKSQRPNRLTGDVADYTPTKRAVQSRKRCSVCSKHLSYMGCHQCASITALHLT